MSFLAWPEALPLLLLAPLAWFVMRALQKGREKKLEQLVGPEVRRLAPDLGNRSARRWLACAALLLALIAVLQPLWGEGVAKIEQRGIDMLVCLDVSRSMLARDLEPSRLERAKLEIRSLAGRARGDRLGLVVFAGEARLVSPLTRDMESFMELVDMASPLSVERGGTDIGAALEKALDALAGSSGDHEVVLLFTDGEDLEQKGLAAAERCRERNITVHCIGLGSARGSKIALGTGEGFLMDRSGNEVVSIMDPNALLRIAATAGGAFMDAGARPVLKLYEKEIQGKAQKTFDIEGRRERRMRFQWPLLAAFLLWIVEMSFTDRKIR